MAVVSGCGSLKRWKANGFKVGPNYARPAMPADPRYVDADQPQVVEERLADAAWWTVFGDPTLDELVTTAYQQNLSVRTAGLRVL